MLQYNFVEASTNKKMLGLPLVQSPRRTCWRGCPFIGQCYGEQWPLGSIWNMVEERGEPLAKVCQRIHGLPPRSRWRWGDVGDVPGCGGHISRRAIEQIVLANLGKYGWSYSHKPVLGDGAMASKNRETIRWANDNGFTINLSAEGWKKADALADLEVGPVFAVLPHNWMDKQAWKRSHTPQGREIRQCPAEISQVRCATCGGNRGPLCARAERDFIVGVSTHGCNRNRIAAIVAEIEMFGRF